jgi:hypothetical protein
MKRIRGIVVGRGRVCEDDASAQTMFESATRGWGHCRPRINSFLLANLRVKKGKIGIVAMHKTRSTVKSSRHFALTPYEGENCSD